MSKINTNLYRAAEVRAMDNMMIRQYGVPGMELMERAGAAAFALLRDKWPGARRIAVFCGTGNNGGDGYVIARLAHEAGMGVTLYQIGDHGKLKGDALTAAERLSGTGAAVLAWRADAKIDAEVIVDALLGTGLSGEVSGYYRQAIEAINHSAIPVLAVDIPSGLHADTGAILGVAVKAAQTISFIAMKQGLYTGAAAEQVGELHFADLDVPPELYSHFIPTAQTCCYADLKSALPARPRTAHKGQAGHVLVIGGNHGFSGAAYMAGEAALRSGAGLVSIATRTEHAASFHPERPELMLHGAEEPAQLQPLLAGADVLAVGPGLGQDGWAQQCFQAALASNKPMVLDADGLNLLAQTPQQRDNWVLTPHPGEAGRLLNVTATVVNADRFGAVENLQGRYGGTVVLKGAGSLIFSGQGPAAVCTDGNPGMASGGMGDVLTGIIASLWAQGLPRAEAAQLGVCLHAAAADHAAGEAERGLLAMDLMPWIRQLVNP